MTKPVQRYAAKAKKRDEQQSRTTASGISTAALSKLFDIGPYDRNQISKAQIDRLRELIDTASATVVAERLELTVESLLRVTSGFGHTLKPKTAARIRAFLAGKR